MIGAPEDVDGIVDREGAGGGSALLEGRERHLVPLDEVYLFDHPTLGAVALQAADDHDSVLLAADQGDLSPGTGQADLKEAPLVLSHIVELKDVAVRHGRVDTPGDDYLILVYGTGRPVHDLKEHRRKKLPLLSDDVIPKTALDYPIRTGIETAHEVDKAFIVSDSLL